MSESLLPYPTVLLLGASGQLGTAIREAFARLAPDCTLIATSRNPAPKEEDRGIWLRLDPLAEEWPSLPQVDIVINAVGAIHATDAMPFEKVHGGVTAAILARRESLGHPKIIQISALGADPEHSSAFLRTKGEADAMLLRHPHTLVLRPSIVCTPGTMIAKRFQTLLGISRFSLGKLLMPKGFGETKIQPILGDDLGKAVVHAALADFVGSMALPLVGPEEISLRNLLETMAEAQGRKIRLIEVPREIVESFVTHFVSVWFPDVINADQFQLLFEDNVAAVEPTLNLLGRRPGSTLDFWRAEAGRSDEKLEAHARKMPPAVALEGPTAIQEGMAMSS